MKVSELGEFGLIDLLAKIVSSSQDNKIEAWRQLIIGMGSDDAAAWHGDTSIQLATVDSFIQDVHFSLGTTSWKELGWKALAANLSDIAAMGGVPRYALVSLTLPDHTEVEEVTALYQGMMELAQPFDVAIVGGDTSSAPLVTITITILGSASQDKQILTRSGAEPGEKVAVTGYLGTAAAGWEMLTRQLQFDSEATAGLKGAFLHPYPRIAEGQRLVEQGIKTAIDISDGLISDLTHICKSSQVSARIEVERVPILPIVKANFSDRAHELALSGGEDYELLFTGSDEVIDKVKTAVSCPVTVIGEITAAQPVRITIVDGRGNPVKLSKAGWEHFAKR
ncbi:MAG: thiamine-phosphate kinase [Dehalococcoidia bacterium]|nr:MAG: thiamine-phosphate kinase [Dehalococcoidia bacterium]